MTTLNIFTDGGSRGNPGPSACAFVVKNNVGRILYQEGKFLGKTTNNEAEYQGIILALEWLIKNKKKVYFYCCSGFISGPNQMLKKSQQEININFFLDSKLLVNQLNGLFKIKNSRLRELILKIKMNELKTGAKIFYSLISREENKEADKLVNKILDDYNMKTKLINNKIC